MLRRMLAAAALAAMALALAGCPGGARRGGGAPQAANVVMTDFRFNPEALTMPRGKATFVLQNNGPSVHNFTVTGVPGARSQDLAPGATQNLEVILDKPGTYEVICTVPGHSEMGMRGTLTVQ